MNFQITIFDDELITPAPTVPYDFLAEVGTRRGEAVSENDLSQVSTRIPPRGFARVRAFTEDADGDGF